MEMTLRPANEQEQLYGSSQSSQISAQTGFLGWLRGDVGNSEDAFKIKWYSYGNSPQNEDCQEEIDAILGILRTEKRYDEFLNDRKLCVLTVRFILRTFQTGFIKEPVTGSIYKTTPIFCK